MVNIPTLALITSNIIPVIGVLFFKWDASAIIFLYWFENIVVGIYNILKMALAQAPPTTTGTVGGKVTPANKAFVIPFFILHFGMFTFVHGVFVFSLFIKDLVLIQSLIIALASLFVSHGISFTTNYLGKEEYKRTAPDSLMMAPYKRVVIMHFVIILSGMFTIFSNQSMVSLLLLVLLKTLADLASHLFEHTGSNTYRLKPSAEKFVRFFFPGVQFGQSSKVMSLNEDQVKIINKIFPNLEEFATKAYEESVKSGKFDELSKNMDPKTVEYIKNYFADKKARQHSTQEKPQLKTK